jgi:hypothetical protein
MNASLDLSDPLARALARRNVDPNEVAKTFTHLRALYERADGDDGRRAALALWWRWLETVAGPGARGRAQRAHPGLLPRDRGCLPAAPAQPGAGDAGSGAGAVRLLRYYRNTPGALGQPALFGGDAPAEAPPPPREPARPPEPPRPSAPEMPAVGQVFTGRVLQIDESAIAVEVPGFEAAQAIGVIKAEHLGGRRYREGNAARVEVLAVRALKSGRTIVELRPAVRQGDASP